MTHRPDARERITAPSTTSGASMFFIQDAATTRDVAFDSKRVIEFPSNLTLGKAMHQLAENRILSAPVWDATQNKYLGFVDIADLLTLAVGVDVISQLIPREAYTKPPTELKDFNAELTLRDLFEDHTATSTPWFPVQEGEKLRTVVDILASKAKRVPVLNKEGRVVQIISQSQITVLINKFEAMSNILSKDTLAQTGFGIKPVITVKASDPARLAFQLMVDHGVSSVCVVDEDSGAVLTAMSTKDIRLLPRIESAALVDGNLLDLTCQQFVAKIRELDVTTTTAACAVVDLHSSLHNVLGKLAASRLHRVYVIDGNRKPVGVISVSDIVVALQSVQHKQ